MKRAVPNLKFMANYVHQLKFADQPSNPSQKDAPSPVSEVKKLKTKTFPIKNLAEEASSSFHAKIKNITEMKDRVKDRTLNPSHVCGIAKWHRFSALNDCMKGFRLGELTVVTGPTGSGKTTFLSEYTLDLCLAGVSTLWCSLEVPIDKLISWLMQQYSKVDFSGLPEEISHKKFDEFYDRMTRDLANMYFYDQHGSVSIDELSEAIEHQNSLKKLDHVVVDNLQFMQNSSRHASNFDKYMLQDLIFSELRQLATRKNIHVTLVVHPKKELEGTDLNMNSLYGGIKASQEADNILIIQKVVKPWADPPFMKYLQLHKNRSVGELVLGNTLRMDFDPRTKCHTLRKVSNQTKMPVYANQGRFNGLYNNNSNGGFNNKPSGQWSSPYNKTADFNQPPMLE